MSFNPLTPRNDVWAAQGCPGPSHILAPYIDISPPPSIFPSRAYTSPPKLCYHMSTPGNLLAPIYIWTYSPILRPSSSLHSIDFPGVPGLSQLCNDASYPYDDCCLPHSCFHFLVALWTSVGDISPTIYDLPIFAFDNAPPRSAMMYRFLAFTPRHSRLVQFLKVYFLLNRVIYSHNYLGKYARPIP